MGLVGTTPGDDPSPALAVSFEWPIAWLRTVEPIPKFDREVICLQRYSTDQALAGGTHAFSTIKQGADPPDALVTTSRGTVGIEATALTLQDRRGVHGLFHQFRRELLRREPAAFSKLVGHVVYVWFEAPDDPGLAKPHKKSDEDAVSELLTELCAYEPDSEQMRVPIRTLPEQAPPIPLATTQAGARFFAYPFLGGVPSSMLATIAGFDVGIVHTTLITAQAGWTEIQRLVDSHDKPGVNVLLVSAGAPDQHGLVYPAEEALATFLIDHPIGLGRQPAHIAQVILHTWVSGRATLLYPEIKPVFGPLYQSLTPQHHPLEISG